MSRTLGPTRWGSSAALAGLLALALTALAALALASQANAAFSLTKCKGSSITGRGASFARDAHDKVFIFNFKTFYCSAASGSTAGVTYEAAGSGAGRLSVKVRTDTPRFGMSDEAPSPAEVQLMNTGTNSKEEVDSDPSNDGKIHVVPAAVGAVAPLVNFPDGCNPEALKDEFRTVSKAEIEGTPTKKALLRVRFPKTLFEQVWAGEIKDWDDAFTDLAGVAACEKPIIRVVRFDESGTSFAFKDELNAINPTRNWLTEFATVKPALTRKWPNAAAFGPREDCPKVKNSKEEMVFPEGPGADSTVPGAPGADQLMSACSNSNGPLVTTLINTDGSIGYSDISTARNASPSLAVTGSGSPPDKYWTQLQDGAAPPVWQEPTADPNGFIAGGTAGANCAAAQFKNVPADTFGDWSKTSGVNSPGAYGVCTFTYGLVFDDNADVWGNIPATFAQEEAKARTVKDYWESALTNEAQLLLTGKDYAPLPASILAISRKAIQGIEWNASGDGGGGGGGGGSGSGGGGSGGNPPPVVKPSNVFTLLRKSISSKTGGATLSVKLPGAGRLEMVATAKNGKKAIKVGSAVLNANQTGTFNVPLRPSGAAKKVLREKGQLTVKVELTFTPTGGDANESTSSLVLKLKKPAKRN